MDNTKVDALYKEWQRFVKEHACMLRDGRMRGLSPEELNDLGAGYVLRIDSAYARFIDAEQRQGRGVAACA